MLQSILGKLKVLFKNPMVIFVYGIMTHWYILVMVPAVVVTYWVFMGLKDVNFFAASEKIVSSSLTTTKSIAKYCTPQINDFRDFWACIQNPPEYEEDANEKSLTKAVTDLLDISNYFDKKPKEEPIKTKETKDPYANYDPEDPNRQPNSSH